MRLLRRLERPTPALLGIILVILALSPELKMRIRDAASAFGGSVDLQILVELALWIAIGAWVGRILAKGLAARTYSFATLGGPLRLVLIFVVPGLDHRGRLLLGPVGDPQHPVPRPRHDVAIDLRRDPARPRVLSGDVDMGATLLRGDDRHLDGRLGCAPNLGAAHRCRRLRPLPLVCRTSHPGRRDDRCGDSHVDGDKARLARPHRGPGLEASGDIGRPGTCGGARGHTHQGRAVGFCLWSVGAACASTAGAGQTPRHDGARRHRPWR